MQLPAPQLRTYPRIVSIAEKFNAMVRLGRRNSRMKDFHDVWALSSEFPFEGPALREAVAACFERRADPWTPEIPDALTSAFYSDAELERLTMGATVRTIGMSDVNSLVTPIPPLAEQDQIVRHILHHRAQLDTLIAKVGDAIDRLKELRTALIAAAVTGKIDVRDEVA